MNKKQKYKIKKILNKYLGIQIYRVKHDPAQSKKPKYTMEFTHDPAISFMENPKYKEALIQELTSVADAFLSKNVFPTSGTHPTYEIVTDFFEVYTSRPFTGNTHGSGFHNAFWIYLMARIINPELIVESGVWKGHTTWLLSQACPAADIFGFDLSFTYLEYDIDKIEFLQQDWGDYNFPEFDKDKALVFFDCHVNHAKRLLEAKAKGFKHLLFDDNPPVHKLYSFKPGIPTAAMLSSGEGLDSPEISWVWRGEKITETIDLDQANKARELIKEQHLFPDVGGLTRYGGFTFLTYVQI